MSDATPLHVVVSDLQAPSTTLNCRTLRSLSWCPHCQGHRTPHPTRVTLSVRGGPLTKSTVCSSSLLKTATDPPSASPLSAVAPVSVILKGWKHTNILLGEAGHHSIGIDFDICSYTGGWFNTPFYLRNSPTVFSVRCIVCLCIRRV